MQRMGHAGRTRSMSLIVAALLSLAAACGKRVETSDASERISLLVNNRGYFDVTVYALRSPGTSGVRIGDASGGATVSLSVRLADLQAGGRLVLRVRAIGSRREWISPALVVGAGAKARLNVYSTNSGDMSQSTLFAEY